MPDLIWVTCEVPGVLEEVFENPKGILLVSLCTTMSIWD